MFVDVPTCQDEDEYIGGFYFCEVSLEYLTEEAVISSSNIFNSYPSVDKT